MNHSGHDDDADSDPLATILMVMIVIIVAALVLSQLFYLPSFSAEQVPAVYRIESIRHTNLDGVLDYDGYVVLKNTGTIARKNRDLFVRTYLNGAETHCTIPTLNADEFCSSAHTDVATIGGSGAKGSPDSSLSRWYGDQLIAIDYENGIFHPADTIRIDVFDKITGKIVSRDSWPRKDPRTTASWWVSLFTHQAV